MSVVLRCPHCGTTKATAGECEACHEAQVRYFCSNHTPGVWLDDSRCARCGARFGEPARVPSVPPAPTVRVRTRSPAAARARATAAPPRPSRASAPPVRGDGWSDERTPRPSYLERGSGPSPLALLQKILHAALRARLAARAAPEPPRPSLRRGLGGCLMRLVLAVVLLLLALAGGAFMFGHFMLQGS